MRTYTMDDIEKISIVGKPTVNKLSYGTIYSVTAKNYSQYSFMFFPFASGDAFILVAIDGDPPQDANEKEIEVILKAVRK